MNKRRKTWIINHLFNIAKSVEPVRGARTMAAIVNSRGRIVSYGFCQLKTHPFQKKFQRNKESIFLHAETHAIKNALRLLGVRSLKDYSIFIVRAKRNEITRKWELGTSKPCKGCQSCIETHEIKEIYYHG